MDTNNAAALLMNFSNINNPILSQILMEASRPKFQGTAEHFSKISPSVGGIPETFEIHFSIHRGNTNFVNF